MKRVLLLLLSVITVAASAAPQLGILILTPDLRPGLYDPGAEVALQLALYNSGDAPDSAPFALTLPDGFAIKDVVAFPLDWSCAASRQVVRCSGGAIAPHDSVRITTTATAPSDPAGGLFTATATLGELQEPIGLEVNRLFTVTTAADSGAGSLRDAVERANAECQSLACKATFAINDATIHLGTPLPAITACGGVVLDASQRNVSVRGDDLPFGNGIEIATRCAATDVVRPVDIRGLTIAGFPDNGILVTSDDAGFVRHIIEGCTIRDNRLRGISVDAPHVALYVSGNQLLHNGRSGIAVWRGTDVTISGNGAGLNGASGIFVASGFAYVSYNVIAYNGDFGLGYAPSARAFAGYANVLHDNRLGGFSTFGDTRVPAPRITNAHYDAARNVTVVEGTWPGVAPPYGLVPVWLAINHTTDLSGHAEAELPIIQATYVDARTGTWTGEIPGDARGYIVTAQAGWQQYADSQMSAMSELSEGFVVP